MADAKPIERDYRIGEVAVLLGVSTSALRFWEQQFPGKVRVARSHSGQRVYSTKDVAKLATIRDLVRKDGLTHRGTKKALYDREPAAESTIADLIAEVGRLQEECDRLRAELNTPHTKDFLEAVRIEAAHQRERWGSEHDAGKTGADWFWLIGYLAGKALYAGIAGDADKSLHHTISTAAVCLNWHAHISGESTSMRPGLADDDPRKDGTSG